MCDTCDAMEVHLFFLSLFALHSFEAELSTYSMLRFQVKTTAKIKANRLRQIQRTKRLRPKLRLRLRLRLKLRLRIRLNILRFIQLFKVSTVKLGTDLSSMTFMQELKTSLTYVCVYSKSQVKRVTALKCTQFQLYLYTK